MLGNSVNRRQNSSYSVVEMSRARNGSRSSSNGVGISNEQFQMLLSCMGTSNNLKQETPSALGNPGPLGLGGFALTTFMLSVFNAGSNLIDSRLLGVVVPVALFYGGIAQFAAGMWEFRTNNTFGATAFASYGAFWMSFAGYIFFIVPQIEATGKANSATGLFLLAWLIFTLYMTIASWRASRVLFILFVLLSITFLLLVIGALANKSVVTNVGGWFGIVTAAVAWYGSAAVVINSTWKVPIFPIGVYKPPKENETKTK